MKLITDGKKWAIIETKSSEPITYWFDFIHAGFGNSIESCWFECEDEDSWTDEETARRWLRNLKEIK